MDAILLNVAEQFGTPCFVYDVAAIEAKVSRIKQAFGGRFSISYAMKSNPNPAILRWFEANVPYLDVSSGGELRRAIAAGWDPARISFTGPAKTRTQLEYALSVGVGHIVAESVAECKEISEIARSAGVTQSVLVRIAPARLPKGFGVRMAGKPSQFGIDEEDIEPALQDILALNGVAVDGFHIYSGTQSLNTDAIAENYHIFAEIFRKCAALVHRPIKHVIFGSGIGIPYHESDQPVDLERLAELVNPLLDEMRREPAFTGSEFLLETGRYLVGEAGIYLTRVVRIKASRGHKIAICDGGMNHHLGAAGHLGTFIHRNYPMQALHVSGARSGEESYDIVGPLCTTIDTLAHKVTLPRLEPGDIIAIKSSGAYGPTASPVNFISHDPPLEVLIDSRHAHVAALDISTHAPDGTASVAVEQRW